MVKSSYKNHLNRRRGISTIVGGIIFIVLLSAGFSTFFVAMDVQSDTINAQRTISDSIIDKTQEQFAIAVATDDSNPWHELGIQVLNEGNNPIEISNIWLVNKSDSDQPVKTIQVDYRDAFIPPGYNSSIIENQRLVIDPALFPGEPDLYDIKVVSSLGTMRQTELKVGGNNYLQAELFPIPPDVRHNENVTLALRVTNVGPTEIIGITPDLDFAPNGIQPGRETWLSVPEFISPSPVDLKPSESAIFSWQSTLTNTGTFGEKVKFTNSATGTESATGFGVSTNVASDKITVRDPAGGGGGAGTEIVIIDELFAQPAINMIVPNPAGDDNEQALWAVTVANPTDATMDVSKISLTILYAGANSNQEIWTVTDCAHTSLTPATDYWSCSNDNLLVWYDDTPPYYVESIPPRSAYTFMLTVKPGKTTSGISLDTVVVHAAVFTTLGMFGQATWTSAMIDGGEVIANVYLTDDTVSPYTDPTKMRGSRVGITAGSTQTFHVALADLNLSSQNIEAGAQLIINIPKEWTVNIPSISDDGFNGIPTYTPFDDGSSQIVGVLTNDLAVGGKIITFDAVAPSPACDTMYVMHVLGNGISNNGYQIGPVAEIVLQVDSPPPGPVCP